MKQTYDTQNVKTTLEGELFKLKKAFASNDEKYLSNTQLEKAIAGIEHIIKLDRMLINNSV